MSIRRKYQNRNYKKSKRKSYKKSKSKSRCRSRCRSRYRSRYRYDNKEKKIGECIGKKRIVCMSDPNCNTTLRGCRRKKNLKKIGLFYGPTLSNIS
jgi:hypothetical protein